MRGLSQRLYEYNEGEIAGILDTWGHCPPSPPMYLGIYRPEEGLTSTGWADLICSVASPLYFFVFVFVFVVVFFCVLLLVPLFVFKEGEMTKLIESCIDFSLLSWLSWTNPVTLQHYNFVSVGILERILHVEITFWITWFPDDRMFFIQFMETRQYFVFYCTLFCCMVFHCIVCNGNPLFLVQSVTLLYPISLCNYYIAMVFYCIVFYENAL